MDKKIVVTVLVAVIAAGGVGFFGGMSYGKNSAQPASGGRGQFAGFSGAGAGRSRGQNTSGGFATGEIISTDASSLTMKLQDGGSKIVFFSGTTQIGKFVVGGSRDLATGQRVTVMGTANADGSMTATSIQIRPASSSAPAFQGQ